MHTQPESAVSPGTGPGQDTRQRIAAIYARLLKVRDVGENDDFFVLGGTSLSAIALLDTIAEELGVHVAANDFYRATRVAELADLADAGRDAR